MRVAILLVLTLLAGCLESGSPTPTPGASPSPSPSPSPSALPSPSPSPSPSPGLPDAASTEASGVALTATRTGEDPLRVRATATNEGDDATVRGGCEVPWRFVVRAENGAIVRTEAPMARCLGFSNEPFPTGATSEANFSWDGTAYDEEGNGSAAATGRYELEVLFTIRRADIEERVSVKLPFEL